MRKNNIENNPIVVKSFNFALKVIKLTDQLFIDNKKNLSIQLLKSGTSIGANIREAQNSEKQIRFHSQNENCCKRS